MSDLHSEIERLRQRVAELEYELKAAKTEEEGQLARLMDFYDLTATEARVVRILANARGGAVSRPSIWEAIGRDTDLRSIDAHIKRLRCKNKGKLLVGTMYGVGYRLSPESAKAARDVMEGRVQPDAQPRSFYCENRKNAAQLRRRGKAVHTAENAIEKLAVCQ